MCLLITDPLAHLLLCGLGGCHLQIVQVRLLNLSQWPWFRAENGPDFFGLALKSSHPRPIYAVIGPGPACQSSEPGQAWPVYVLDQIGLELWIGAFFCVRKLTLYVVHM